MSRNRNGWTRFGARKLGFSAAIAAGIASLMQSIPAAAQVAWTDGSGTHEWNTPGNWNPSTVPTASDAVTFGDLGVGPITISSAPANAGTISFSPLVGVYRIGAGGTSQSLTLNSAAAYSIFSGPAGTTGVGQFDGPLSLAAGNLPTISAGTIRLTNATNSFGAGAGFTVNTGGTLRFAGVSTGSLSSATVSNPLAASTVTLGGGTLTLDQAVFSELPLTNGLRGRLLGIGAGLASGQLQNVNFNTAVGGTTGGQTVTGISSNTILALPAYAANNPGTPPGIGGFPGLTPATNFTLRYSGMINAAVGGTYVFDTTTDDNSLLYIDGQVVVNNDASQGATTRMGAVSLGAGLHTFEVRYAQGGGGGTFPTPAYITPYGVRVPISSNALFYNNSSTTGTGVGQDLATVALGNSVVATAGTTQTIRLNGYVSMPQVTQIGTAASGTQLVAPTASMNALTIGGAGVTGLSVSSLAPTSLRFNSTTIAAGSGTVVFDTSGADLIPGRIIQPGTPNTNVTYRKTGTGALILDNVQASTNNNNFGTGAIIDVQAGSLSAVGGYTASATVGTNPLGTAVIQLNGGNLQLSSVNTFAGSTTADFSFVNTVSVLQNATINAVPAQNNPATGAVVTQATNTITLGGASNGLSIAAGKTLTIAMPVNYATSLATPTDYSRLTIAGPLSGSGNLTMLGGTTTAAVAAGVVTTAANAGVVQLSGSGSGFSGTITIGAPSTAYGSNAVGGQIRAIGANTATEDRFGTGALVLNRGVLGLRSNGTGSNGSISFGNNVTVTGAYGFQFNVDRNSANTGNTFQFGTLTLDTSAANNPQQFSLVQTAGANSYAIQFTGLTTFSKPVQFDTTSANLVLSGGFSGAGGGVLKTGGNALVLQGTGTTYNNSNVVALAGTVQVGGTATFGSNVLAVSQGAVAVVADANTSTGASAFGGTVTLRNGAVFRVDANKPLPTLSTNVPAGFSGTPGGGILSLNVANFSGTVTMPAGVNGLYLGTSQGSGQYTGGTILPNGTQYLLGGSSVANSVLRITGNGTLPVLADNVVATSVRIGNRYFTAIGGQPSTVRFDSAVSNTYTGSTQIDPGFTADVQVGGVRTPFSTGAVSVAGNLSFTGANGSAVNSDNSANSNAYTFAPGSALTFNQSAASTVAGGMWHDSVAIGLYGTVLTLQGASTITAAETVGAISFDGASAITINKNTGTSATLTAAGLDRLAGSKGTLTLRTGTANNPLNTANEVLSVTGGLPATITNQNILPAYIVAQNNGTALPGFAINNSGSLAPLGTYVTTSPNGLTTADVYDITGATALTATSTVGSLRVSGTNAVTGTAAAHKIVIGTAGGGLIFNGSATHTAAFDFGANEGLVYVASGATASLTNAGAGVGGILGTGGLTKFGPGALSINNAALGSAAAALSGTITINEGSLSLTVPTGTSTTVPITNTNSLVMNGGTLTLRNDVSATYFGPVTVRGNAAYDIGRAGGTSANPNFTVGNLTLGESARSDAITLTGVVNGSPNLVVGTTALNQDAIFSGGRIILNGAITGATGGRSIVATGGVNIFFRNFANTNLNGVVIQNGTFVPDSAATYSVGAPITFYNSATVFGTQASTITDPLLVYSGATFRGSTNYGFSPNGSGNNMVTIGTAEQPTPVTINAASDAAGTFRTTFTNVNLYSNALTIGNGGFTAGNTGNTRALEFVKGTGTWNLSGPIDIQANGGVHFVIPNVATAGAIAPEFANVTTLRSAAGAGARAEFWFSGDAGTGSLPRVQFTRTILDGSLRIDPNSVSGSPAGNNAHVSLGDVYVNGDRELWIYDAINNGNTNNGVDFGKVYGTADSILRLTTSNTTLGNALLTNDQSQTMLGSIYLTATAGAGVFRMDTTGALGAQGIVAGTVRLEIPGGTTLTAADNISVASGGILSGTGISQLTLNGPSTGPRFTWDPGAVLQFGSGGSLATTGLSGATTNLPAGLAGTAPIGELRLAANVDANRAGGGNNSALTVTLGGASGLGTIANDGTARTITSGNITVGGPFFVRGQITFGGSTATNNILNFVADPNLPAAAKGDMILSATANTTFLLSNTSTGTAGDESGLHRVVITAGAANFAATLQAQAASSVGGTGATKPEFWVINGANQTVNQLNPGSAASSTAAGLVGNIRLEHNGLLQLDDGNNITSNGGTINTFAGSIVNITNAGAIGSIPTGISVGPGTVVRIGVTNIANFSAFQSPAATYVVTGGFTQNNVISLNRDATVPWSATLSASASATLTSSGGVSIGANGGTITSGSGTTLTYAGTLTTSGNTLTVGSPYVFNAATTPANGTFLYSGASSLGSSTVNIVGGATFQAQSTAVSSTNNLNIDGTFKPNNVADVTVGTVTSTGRAVLSPAAAKTLTLGGIGPRTNGGVYAITTATGTLGTTEKVIVSSGAPANVAGGYNFVSPIFINATDISFLTHDATNGFTNATDTAALASATTTQIATVSGATSATTTLASPKTVGALSMFDTVGTGLTNGQILSLTGALTVATGGVITSGGPSGSTNTGSHTISGAGGLNFNGQEAVFFVGNNQALIVSTAISNATGLTKFGGNTLQISTAIGTGLGTAPTLNAMQGNLRLGVANALPTDATLNIGGAGVFDMNNFSQQVAGITGTGTINNQATTVAAQTLTLAGAGNYTFDGIVTTSTNLAKTGTGTQTFTNNITSTLNAITVGAGTLSFTGHLTTGALTTVNGGTMNLSGGGWLNGITINGGAANLTGRSFVFGNSSSLTVNGGSAALSGPNTDSVLLTGTLTVNSGVVTMDPAASHYILGTTTYAQTAAGSNVVINGAYNVFNGAATFANNGSVTINGVNTFNNTTTFHQSTGAVSAVTFGSGSTTVFNGPTAISLAGGSVGGIVQFNSSVNLRGGTAPLDPVAGVRIPGSVGLVTIGDDTSNTAASLVATSTQNQTIDRPIATGRGSGLYTVGSTATAGVLTFTNTVTLNDSLAVTASNGTTVIMSGVVSSPTGNFGLTKTGVGIMTITAANTYTGGTYVSAGTLRVNNTAGSGTGTAAVEVNTGATLGGVGTIAGPAVINAGGIVNPGTDAATGTLTVGSASLATATSTLRARLNGSGAGQYDQLAISNNGTATLSGLGGAHPALTLNLNTPLTGDGSERFVLVSNLTPGAGGALGASDYFGTLNIEGTGYVSPSLGNTLSAPSGGVQVLSDPNNTGFTYTLHYNVDSNDPTFATPGNDVVLTAVPEPASIGLAAIAGLGLLARRRRAVTRT